MDLFVSKVDLNQAPNKRERYIFFGAVFIFFMVFIKSCWVPSSRAITEVKKELMAVETEMKSLRPQGTKAKGAEVIPGDPQKIAQYVKLAQSAGDAPDAAVMRELSSPLVLKDIKIVSTSFDDMGREGGVARRRFKYSLFGSFETMGDFLEAVYNVPLLIDIDKVKISSAGEGTGDVNTDVEGVVYGWK